MGPTTLKGAPKRAPRRANSYTAIRNLKPETTSYEAADKEGLFVEVLPTGAKVFRFRYRLNGRREKVTIGRWLDVKEGAGTLAWARQEHAKYRAMVVAGKSPAKARRDEVANAAMDDSTFGGFVEHRYLPDIKARLRRPEQNERRLERHLLPTLKNRLLSEIDAGDLLAILDPLKATDRVQEARQTLILAKAVFGLAVMRQKILHNPARDIPLKMLGAAGKRVRGLSEDELRMLLAALRQATFLSREHVIALELLFLTLCRKGELVAARWEHVDLDGTARWSELNINGFEGAKWFVPAENMKTGVPHLVPLSTRAVELFRELKVRAMGSALVLPALLGRRDKPMADSSLNWALWQMTRPRAGAASPMLDLPHFTLCA